MEYVRTHLWNLPLIDYECHKSKKEMKVQLAEVEEKLQCTLLMTIIDTSEVSLLQGFNEQVMKKGIWYLDNGQTHPSFFNSSSSSFSFFQVLFLCFVFFFCGLFFSF